MLQNAQILENKKIIDDVVGHTLVSASTTQKEVKSEL